MSDDVGMNMLGKVETNRATARARTLRVVIGHRRNSREVREAQRYPRGVPLDVWRAGKRGGFSRRRKDACQQDAFRVSGSEPWMNTTVGFVKSLDNVMAKDQQFFVLGEWHG